MGKKTRPTREKRRGRQEAGGAFARVVSVIRSHDRSASWLVFLFGILIFFLFQSYLVLLPLWGRSVLPEPDDTLPYVLNAARMTECPDDHCPALKDLQNQLGTPSPDPEVAKYRSWAANIFQYNDIFFAYLLILLNKLGLDLILAYKMIYSAAPFLFGLGFACLLASIWGLPAAGLGLLLLAFKVFPHSGLHWLVPWNFTMGLAMFMWARVIARNGAAPFSLVIGSLILMGFHPVGAIYAVIAGLIAWSLGGFKFRFKTMMALGGIGLLVLVFLLLPHGRIISLSHYLPSVTGVREIFFQGISSGAGVFSTIKQLRLGLFGILPFFCGALAIGFFSVSADRRARAAKVFFFVALFSFLGLWYPPRQPADVFFRIWIPAVVVLFGAVGQALMVSLKWAGEYIEGRGQDENSEENFKRPAFWPMVLLFVLGGYVFHMSVTGTEQIVAMADFSRQRQPVEFCREQTQRLLSAGQPQDRVLYLSMLAMPYFLINGGMSMGAVYYHPVLAGEKTEQDLLQSPNLKFAVAYNPLVYSPSFEAQHERRWAITMPEFYFSPLTYPKKYGPILIEDSIPMADYKWMDIEPRGESRPRVLRVTIENPSNTRDRQWLTTRESGEKKPGRGMRVLLIPLDEFGKAQIDRAVESEIPARTRKEIIFDLTSFPEIKTFRILFPGLGSAARIDGIHFDSDALAWPWEQKARVTLMHRKWEVGEMIVSFDPLDLLPEPLRRFGVDVLDDCGSTVLLKLNRSDRAPGTGS